MGAKSEWLDGRMIANLALYYILVDDFQVTRRVGLTSFTVLNAQAVTSRGLDLDVVARPLEGLDLIAGLGYIDARFDRFRVARTSERFDGNDIQLVPPYTFSVAMQYRTATADSLGWNTRASVATASSRTTRVDRRPTSC